MCYGHYNCYLHFHIVWLTVYCLQCKFFFCVPPTRPSYLKMMAHTVIRTQKMSKSLLWIILFVTEYLCKENQINLIKNVWTLFLLRFQWIWINKSSEKSYRFYSFLSLGVQCECAQDLNWCIIKVLCYFLFRLSILFSADSEIIDFPMVYSPEWEADLSRYQSHLNGLENCPEHDLDVLFWSFKCVSMLSKPYAPWWNDTYDGFKIV